MTMEKLRLWSFTLVLGGIGGFLFHLATMPLAWMMGAMCITTAAALGGLKVAVSPRLRMVMISVLGLMLGSTFTPEIAEQAGQWILSLSGLVLYVLVSTGLVMLYLHRVAGWGPVTSYFSAAPGGLNEMVLTGGAMGGDDRTIALNHALRILLIVFLVPIGFRLFGGYEGGQMTQAMGSIFGLSWQDAAFLGVSAVIGVTAAQIVRLPAAALTGPMILSAAFHIAGLTDSHPPAEMVAIAQVVTGAAIGSRFAGVKFSQILDTFRIATGATTILLVLSFLFTALLVWLGELPFIALLLAFVPGGLAEMCLISLALGADVAFVSTHHFARIVLVVLLAPTLFRLLGPRLGMVEKG
ncbi:AbrB family transcriptional regulator [Telmatospirillum sp. J64-1]|uniref:AbrB family transcriptional regulator n=1 Tax=Telmatospirillum sp. J64-1 TaxID=2502183 RepID=UPI002107D365|nr:AbrB family transcriptional regulator [Telmatospirillum sp. J64-1]